MRRRKPRPFALLTFAPKPERAPDPPLAEKARWIAEHAPHGAAVFERIFDDYIASRKAARARG